MIVNNRYCGNPPLKQQKNFITEKFNGGSLRRSVRYTNTKVMFCC